MSSFNLLRREIREYIYDQGWPSLSKIQEASIKYIAETENNFILSAPTASGKTEAAFLPAINSIQDWSSGLKIIYVSPLIALINDQFKRISTLCDYLNINVTSWHGEASQAKKKELLTNPNGILLITPESIEAMLSLRSGEARNLFRGSEWVLVDEIHGFLDNNRGVQLNSLLERLQKYMESSPRYIGMSATLHNEDSELAKNFFRNDRTTNILVDRTRNDLKVTTAYFPNNIKEQSDETVNIIYEYSQKEAMLVFPNSRSTVEYLSVNLSRRGKRNNSNTQYFAHHSSLTKELRLSAENFAKSSIYELFTICCTSTLEMGIDIGAVDSIVQYNAPHSVSSLGQRLGRSGRKIKESILHFIATNPWDLLQGLAAISLYEQAKIDRIDSIKKPYDVFAHQILSILMERTGVPLSQFHNLNHEFLNWQSITNCEYETLVQHLIDQGYIEVLEQEMITGVSTEKLLRGGDFFAHFVPEYNFAVHSDMKKVGEIPLTPSVAVGVNIFLAAKIWKITSIDMRGKRIHVVKAVDGKPPVFLSGIGNTSDEIRQRMKEILHDQQSWKNYDDSIQTALEQILADNITPSNLYWVATSSGIGLRTFAGSKINQTLQIFFDIISDTPTFRLDDKKTLIFSTDSAVDIKSVLVDSLKEDWNEDKIYKYLERSSDIVSRYMETIKYRDLLPLELQIKYVSENILDIEHTVIYLERLCSSLALS